MSKRSMPSGGRSLRSAVLLRAKRAVTAQNRLVGRDLSMARLRPRRRRNQVTGGFLGTEVKYFDQSYPATLIAAPATPDNTMLAVPAATNSLNCPSQGDGPTNRDGRKIRMRSIYIKGTLYRNAYEDQIDPGSSIMAYVACVLDRQCNGAAISPSQVFYNPSASATNNCALLRQLEYSDRYRILRDQIFNFDAKTITSQGANLYSSTGLLRHFEWYIPCNILVEFNQLVPTASTVSSMVNNAVSVCAAATAATGLASIYLTYNARVRFTG